MKGGAGVNKNKNKIGGRRDDKMILIIIYKLFFLVGT